MLFVCLGNICRSPLAEGVFAKALAERGLSGAIRVDSAGTGGWHVGEPPDPRSVQVGLDNGVDIRALRGRQLAAQDYRDFDWIVAMDGDNYRTAVSRAPKGAKASVVRYTDFVPGAEGSDVPDPYYGGPDGFQRVYDLLCSGVPRLLAAVEGEAPTA